MRRATVLLGHGSRRGSATDVGLEVLRRQVQESLGQDHAVHVAGLEFTQPPLPSLLQDLVSTDVSEVVVAPLFLFDGRHILEEIPELIAGQAQRFPGLKLVLARTLGLDARIVRLAVRRIEEALTKRRCSHYPCGCARGLFGPDLGVVVVNRGSRPQYDPGLRLRQIAALVQVETGNMCPVLPAQAEYGEPSIGQSIDALALKGVGRIVVLPYLLFPGKVTHDNIAPAVAEARRSHPDLAIELADTLGAAPEIAQVAVDRICEAWGRLAVGIEDGRWRDR